MSFAMMVKFEIARNAARILPGFMHTRPQSEQEHQTDRRARRIRHSNFHT